MAEVETIQPRAAADVARTSPADLQARLLAIVKETFVELRRESAEHGRVALNSSLDRDLGFDSLARVELLLRIERAFDAHLGEEVLSSAETPADLLAALQRALGPSARPHVKGPRALPVRVERADDLIRAPGDATTLVEVLDWHARLHPDQVHIVYSGDSGEEPISYGLLWRRAQAFAGGLRALGLEPKQTVAIMLPTCPEYFYTFFGILCAGGIPVPIYPPARPSQIEEHVRRHSGILSNAATSLLVTVAEARPLARLLKARVPELREIVTAADLVDGPAQAIHPGVRSEDIALLQYTSGSTGNPKGVVLTHANLLANIRAIGELVRLGPSDVIVSWLPLYHDMGLISTWLASVYFGRPIVIMSPLAFLARPARWLWAIHKHRGSLSAAPNFAYELCIKRIDEEDLQGLDLSSWRLAANGAEQVNPDTIERFQEKFARYGFHAEAMMPVYGLAEATVGLLTPPTWRRPVVDRVQRAPFVREGRAAPAGPDDANPLRFVGCGKPLAGHQVRIVDELGRERGERMEGRLEFKGPSATRGYYRNPEQTRRLFDGDWLDSGDRGYFAGNDFYITGRVKDIIIRGGHHIYPDELEQAVGLLPGIRKGCVAAFGVPDPQTGTERLVVLAETRVTEAAQQGPLSQAITRAIVDLLGEPPDEVVLAPPQTVMKTSSGKIRRSATRDLYQSGQVGARSRSTRWQMLRLLASSVLPQARRGLRRAAEIVYAAYAWALFLLLAPPTYIATAATTRARHAWAINCMAARAFLKTAGIRLQVTGLQNLPVGRTCVVVANHASYLDGLALIAALPVSCAFVAKKELQRSWFTRLYLKRLGAEFVERFAVRESVADAEHIVGIVRDGRSVIFFPEGTFMPGAGLLPFHLGAFLTAVRSRSCVVPVAIRGTRSILRDDEWLPRRGDIAISIGPLIEPAICDADTIFSTAVRLRDSARGRILADSGEPDLATTSSP